MSYLVFARKYRPQTFKEVTGQEHITQSLINAIKRKKIAHAYLFSGPRGVGKTSIARIFAKSLNCQKGESASPCLECVNCKEIKEGTSLSVIEMDGASNNSVDDVRELIESFRIPPSLGSKYKIYIIDEVHMLSISAFNALLKSLEEPPENTIFILATTEIHKIPETVLSRCQCYDFRALSFDKIREKLKEILDNEKIKIDAEALRMIAKLSNGSLRDAESLLDKVVSFSDGKSITSKTTGEILGLVQRQVLVSLSQSIINKKANDALKTLQDGFNAGTNVTLFLEEFISYFRELLISKLSANDLLSSFGLDKEEIESLNEATKEVSLQDVQDLYAILRQDGDKIIKSAYPKYAFEAMVVKMATREPVSDIAYLVSALRNRVQDISLNKETAIPQKKTEIKIAPKLETKIEQKEKIFSQNEPKNIEEKIIKRDFEINAFLKFLEDKKELALSSYLKRVSILRNEKSIKITGSKFDIKYLKEVENKEIKKYVKEFTGEGDYKITLSENSDLSGIAKDSILSKQKEKKDHEIKENFEKVYNDDSFKGLKQLFPGTTIEKID